MCFFNLANVNLCFYVFICFVSQNSLVPILEFHPYPCVVIIIFLGFWIAETLLLIIRSVT